MTSIQRKARTSRIILLATLVPSVIVATLDSLCSRLCPPNQFKFQSDHQQPNVWTLECSALILNRIVPGLVTLVTTTDEML